MMDRSSSIAFLIFLSVIIPTKVAAGDDHLVLPSATQQLKGTSGFLPHLVARIDLNGRTIELAGYCFRDTTAHLSFHNNSNSPFGGGTLHITVNQPINSNCSDAYIFATPYRVTGGFYVTTGENTIDFYQWAEAELAYVLNNGLSVFLLDPGAKDIIQMITELPPLFSDSEAGELANIDYLKKHMGANFELRPEPSWVSNVNPDDIRSGDFIAVSKIRGNSGVYQTLQKWVTGAYAGHAAIFLRDPQGNLWVAESGRTNEQDAMIVSILPWDQWWEYEKTKDPASPHIAVLPLHPDLRDKFDELAAWNYALSLNNTGYGYQNLIFSWIDTVNGNYPTPITPDVIASAMIIYGEVEPEDSIDFSSEALNKRLGTEGLGLLGILTELANRESTIGELLAIPEQDDWIYGDGQSTIGVAFAVTVYKHAGLFDPIASSVQTTEFTVKDAYQLKFYEDDKSRLPIWCNAGDDVELPYCQILGKYRMELPGYNTLIPYANMNEQCPSLPPNYERPSGC